MDAKTLTVELQSLRIGLGITLDQVTLRVYSTHPPRLKKHPLVHAQMLNSFQSTNPLLDPENEPSQDQQNLDQSTADRTAGRGTKRPADTMLPVPDTVTPKVSNGNLDVELS